MLITKPLLILSIFYTSIISEGINPRGSETSISFSSINTQIQANANISGVSGLVQFTNPNIRLNNSSPGATLGGVSSNFITFGTDKVLEILADTQIGSSDLTWIFPEDAVIDGKGHKLTLANFQAITVTGSATLTIKNAQIICAARRCLSCSSDSAQIILDNSSLILGNEGLNWIQGSLAFNGVVQVRGSDKSFFAAPVAVELLNQIFEAGFVAISGNAGDALYALDFCGPSDERAGITIGRIDKTGAAYTSDSLSYTTPVWTKVPGNISFVDISIGTDGTIWLVDTNKNVYVYRIHKDTTTALVQAQNISGDFVSVGDRYNVYVLNRSTGVVYKCGDSDRGFLNNLLTGAPQNWSVLPNVKASSIAAGTDGTLWYINLTGQVLCRDNNGNETLVHDGAGRTFAKISAKGTASRNSIALTDLASSRALVSYDNCPFKDLGLSSVVEVATDSDTNLLIIFDSSIIAEDGTYGAPLYYRHSFGERPVLLFDRTLNFAASAGANLTINSGATLAFAEETTLRMNADCAFAQTAYNARRHLVFSDNSSTLLLDRAGLEAVSAGLTLTGGNLVVSGVCHLKPSVWADSYLEISAGMRLKIRSSSNLQVYGQVDYCANSRLMPEVQSTNGPQSVNFGFNQSYAFCNPGYVSAENRGWALFGIKDMDFTFDWYMPGWIDRACVCTNKASVGTNLPSSPNNAAWDEYMSGRVVYLPLQGDLTSFQAYSNVVDFTYESSPSNDVALGTDGTRLYYNDTYRYVLVNESNDIGAPGGIAQLSCGNASNICALLNDGSVYIYTGGWNQVNMNGYIPRSACIGTDGTIWFLDSYGNLKILESSGQIIAPKAVRGLDFVRVHVSGNISSYNGVALTRSGSYYSFDSGRVFESEKISNAVYCSTSSTGFSAAVFPGDNFQADGFGDGGAKFVGYTRGQAPSSWPYPRGAINRPYFDQSQSFLSPAVLDPSYAWAEAKGFALIGFVGPGGQDPGWPNRLTIGMSKLALVSNLPTGTANILYKLNRGGPGGDRFLTANPLNPSDPSVLLALTDLNQFSANEVAVGVDGTLCAIDFNLNVADFASDLNSTGAWSNGVFQWNGSQWNSLGLPGMGGAVIVSVGNAANIWAILSNGQIVKYASGNWNPVNVYPYLGARYIAGGSDGSFWFIAPNGDLKFCSTGGVITNFPGGQGLDLIRVSAAGSSSQFKLVALDRNGQLFSADQFNPLQSEGIFNLTEASVSITGLCAINFAPDQTDAGQVNYGGRCYVGWTKGNIPNTWPYAVSR